MFYDYICDICNTEKEITASIKSKIPKYIPCPKCALDGKENQMHRNWQGGKTARIHIPEWFKATSEENADSPSSLPHLKNIMTHSHPSGREGPIYHQVPEMHVHKDE